MCYFCPKVSDEIGILLHTIEIHDACSKFSMRKSVFDEKIGCNAYRSLHFPVRISEIKSTHHFCTKSGSLRFSQFSGC
jgi:hypothetical protein